MDIRTRTRLGLVKIIMLKGEKGDKGDDGSSGDYALLTNKPTINGTTVDGALTSGDLSLASASGLADVEDDVSGLQTNVGTLQTDVSGLQTDVSGLLTDVLALQDASHGSGYGTCDTSSTTSNSTRTVALPDYTLTKGGIIAVRFSYDVPSGAYLNVNSKGAKRIYYQGATLPAYVISAGDTAFFMYDGDYYRLLGIDKVTPSFQVVHTTKAVSGTLAANGGGSVTMDVTVPEGYSVLVHFAVWNTGVIGVIASLDSFAGTNTSVGIWQNNTRPSTANRGSVHLLTLCIKNG